MHVQVERDAYKVGSRIVGMAVEGKLMHLEEAAALL